MQEQREYCMVIEPNSHDEVTIDIDPILKGFSRLCPASILEFIKGTHNGKIVAYVRIITDRNECVKIAKTLIMTITMDNIAFKNVSCRIPLGYSYIEEALI